MHLSGSGARHAEALCVVGNPAGPSCIHNHAQLIRLIHAYCNIRPDAAYNSPMHSYNSPVHSLQWSSKVRVRV